MKTFTKLLCLTLLLVSITALWSCGDPVVQTYEITTTPDHENSQVTFQIEYSNKYTECTSRLVGLQSAKAISDTTEALPNGNSLKTVTYSLSSSRIAFISIQLTGVNEADNAVAFYRVEATSGYVVIQRIDGLEAA